MEIFLSASASRLSAGTFLRGLVFSLVSTAAPLAHAGAAPAPLTLAQSMTVAEEAIQACAAKGYKVVATVVDPDGVIKVQARGDGGPVHSLRFSFRKAYTTVSMGPMFGVDTSSGVTAFITSKNPAGLSNIASGSADLLFLPGGVLIKAQGRPAGAIGVSGAPLSSEDEACAQAGVAKIQSELDAPAGR
jgi:uncharacterized protein GlcG (DUF336 family)